MSGSENTLPDTGGAFLVFPVGGKPSINPHIPSDIRRRFC